jgi:DNA-binding MarR family transcriptional regulator
MEKIANNTLRDMDLTSAQSNLLFILANADSGTYSMKELEKLLHVSQATTVGIVKRLEQKGYVEGFADSKDKRVKNARITTTGIAVVNGARAHIDFAEEQLVKTLTSVEKQLFRELLRKVCEDLD